MKVLDRDFSTRATSDDRRILDENWAGVLAKASDPKPFSKPHGLATLYDTQGGVLSYETTEFKDYLGISTLSCGERPLRKTLYDHMRVAAVSSALILADDTVFVHQRSEKATHAAGLYDASCGGLCHVDPQGNLNPAKWLAEKLKRELKISPEEVRNVRLTGVHSCAAPDFSGMFSVSLESPLESGQLRERLGAQDAAYDFVPRAHLAEYVFDHFVTRKDMAGDGVAVLLASLPEQEFKDSIARLRQAGTSIEFGTLINGVLTA